MLSQSDLMMLWDALEYYRANVIPEGDAKNDAVWGDICTAMAWITEGFGLDGSEGEL